MAADSWSKNDYRTFITSRRDDVFDNRESSAYAFKRPPPVEVSRGDHCEKEVYFDTDVKALHWETMVRMALRKSSNLDQEFEFKSAPVSPVLTSLSKTDGDVYQGFSANSSDTNCKHQHPVYRKQAEMEEGNQRIPTFVVSQRTVPGPFSQLSPGSLSRMYQPKYSKFCVNSTDVALVETVMDSRSSSFRSESGDRDVGCSSTSRDSNGSSQDASSVSTDAAFDRAFEGYDHRSNNATTPTLSSKPIHMAVPCPTDRDRRSVVTVVNEDNDNTPSNVSWLRSPLKWKGIFVAKKPPKSPARLDARTEHDFRTAVRPNSKLAEISDSKLRSVTRLFNPPNCDDKNLAPGSKPKSFPALPILQQGQPSSKSPQGSLKLKMPFSSDSSDVQSVASADRERDQTGILRIRERWLKYMRMLKPPYGKKSEGTVARGDTLPPQRTAPQEYVHTRAKSMPAIIKTPPLRPRSNPGTVFLTSSNINTTRASTQPAGPSIARKSSAFLSHSSSLVSSSPRLLKSSSPRLMSLSPKVKSSPKVAASTISPRMSSSSASSMSELHSAVQGAIAHCKQSHSGLPSPAPSAHRF